MADFFEIDFMDVESDKSGDAIPLRYSIGGTTYIHVVDGGFQELGESIVDHISKYYDKPSYIDNVVVTHPDSDHAGGLRTVLETFKVGGLWMLRPWLYANELLPRFANYTSVDSLAKRLKTLYPNIAALEEIALARKILIREPFQGASIGAFTVLAPSKSFYLDLILESEKTPETKGEAEKSELEKIFEAIQKATAKAVAVVKAAWGAEIFSPNETSAENEMSVVQFTRLCDERILLTGDAGRRSLTAAADYLVSRAVALPGIDRIQVPHHGSRRNVSTEILDRWLGKRLASKPAPGSEKFTAIVSSAKKDEHHPRKSVVRAFIHRGGKVVATEGQPIRTHRNGPNRGWSAIEPLPYPEEQED